MGFKVGVNVPYVISEYDDKAKYEILDDAVLRIDDPERSNDQNLWMALGGVT